MNGWMDERWMNKWVRSEWEKWVLCSLLLSPFLRKENWHKCPGILEMELSKKDLYFQNIPPFSNSAGCLYVLVTQSCLTLCYPMDCSPPGSSVHGIYQARIWVGLPFPSPGDLLNPGTEPRSPALQADALTSAPPRSLQGLHNNNVSCMRTVSGWNLLANYVIWKCKLWE